MNRHEQGLIVAKFGGSSLATADRVKQVGDIVNADQNRQFIVLSAPGKRDKEDIKVTDLLFDAAQPKDQRRFADPIGKVAARFESIDKGLSKSDIVPSLIDEVRSGIESGQGEAWAASRGEWAMARLFSEYMGEGFVFTDAADVIRLQDKGNIDSQTYAIIDNKLLAESSRHIISGYYGRNQQGEIAVFERGGSDITGAVIARGVHASLYENWTDVDGIRFTDPRRVPDARFVEEITYAELRELGNGGSEVLHRASVLPVKKSSIPINLRNTFNPSHPGTMIVTDRVSKEHENIIGIAGKEGFVSIQISKDGMNEEEGVVERLLHPFHTHGIAFEHIPTGQDSVSVLVHESNLQNGHKQVVIKELEESIQPDELEVVQDIGLITLVGQSIKDNHGHVNKHLYDSLDNAKIKTKLDVSRMRGNSIVVGVENKDVTSAIQILYERFTT